MTTRICAICKESITETEYICQDCDFEISMQDLPKANITYEKIVEMFESREKEGLEV